MRLDSHIEKDVEEELHRDREIDPCDIFVAVTNGVVKLTGSVRSYAQKCHAERDAKRPAGVMGVVNHIEVHLPAIHQRPDAEVALHVAEDIKDELPYAGRLIHAVVNHGWLTLEGDVEWHYQKNRAGAAVLREKGIKGITNLIVVKPKIEPDEVKRKIEEAFRRHAQRDPGIVRSWAERKADPGAEVGSA
jgi:osmotically-inducible protein OsmY